MQDLQLAIDDLRQRAQNTGDPQALTELEQEARDLLTEAKNTPLEAVAQALFSEIAAGNSPSAGAHTAAVRGLVRRARIRIEIAGDDDDIDEAIDILAEALQLDAGSPDVISLLQQAGSHSAQFKQRVQELFERHQVDSAPAPEAAQPPPAPTLDAAADRRPQYASSSSYAAADPDSRSQPEAADRTEGERSFQSSPTLDELLSRLTEYYYSGEYQQTIDTANRILAIQPSSPTAIEYREKSEDNLIRGIVPDHRIPFEARVAYNRANSLVRAGNYEEASGLYKEARELAERDGILTWKDVEQALLDIQDLALARELLVDGDRLMATDSWSEALRKYEGALRVVPNDPQGEERVEMIRRIQQDADQIAVSLNTIGGTLEEQVAQISHVRGLLAQTRQLLPNSQRLAQTQQEVDAKLSSIRSQLSNQAQMELNHVNNSTTLDERVLLLSDAIKLMELGLELDPTDSLFSEMLMDSRKLHADITRAQQVIKRAQALVTQNFDPELAQARQMLSELVTDFAQDERYRQTVNVLFTRYFERAELALQENNISEARTWLDALSEEPFRILGRRAELSRIDIAIRRRRTRGRLVLLAILIILLSMGGLGAAMTRDQWEPALFPSHTPTSTATFTPSMTFTPSITPTPSATFTPSMTATATATATHTPTATRTPTPTWTFTPSHTPTASHTPTITPSPTITPTPTPTPTITPTPLELCQALALTEGIRIRSRPTTAATQVGRIPTGTIVAILEQQRQEGTTEGPIWYFTRIRIEDSYSEGWVRSDTLRPISGAECPDIP